jgi:hypothetical protein
VPGQSLVDRGGGHQAGHEADDERRHRDDAVQHQERPRGDDEVGLRVQVVDQRSGGDVDQRDEHDERLHDGANGRADGVGDLGTEAGQRGPLVDDGEVSVMGASLGSSGGDVGLIDRR